MGQHSTEHPMTLSIKIINLFGKRGEGYGEADKTVKVELTVPAAWDDHAVLEWLFKLTNAPAEAIQGDELTTLTANKANLDRKLWSVSIGDVFKLNDHTYVCASFGWTETTDANARAYFAIEGEKRWRFLPAAIGKPFALCTRRDENKAA
jgi:hypothetical protein